MAHVHQRIWAKLHFYSGMIFANICVLKFKVLMLSCLGEETKLVRYLSKIIHQIFKSERLCSSL